MLVSAETMIHRREHGSQLADREERLEEGRVVRPDPGDTLPSRDTEAAKAVGQAPDPRRQLGVGEASGTRDQGRVIRCDPGPSLDPRSDPEVPRSIQAHPPRIAKNAVLRRTGYRGTEHRSDTTSEQPPKPARDVPDQAAGSPHQPIRRGTVMTQSALAAASGSGTTATDAGYRPGVCNIGPAEIARRRRAGHVGSLATIGLFAVLVAVDAPRWPA